jgi:hypothetical protein
VPGDDPVHAVIVRREDHERFERMPCERIDRTNSVRSPRLARGLSGCGAKSARLSQHNSGSTDTASTVSTVLGSVVGGGFGSSGHGVASKDAATDWIQGHDGVSDATRHGSM